MTKTLSLISKELLVVGNGLDMTAGLESSYLDFFEWRRAKINNNSMTATVWDNIFYSYKVHLHRVPNVPLWRDVEQIIYHFLVYVEPHVTAKMMLLQKHPEKLTTEEQTKLDTYNDSTDDLDWLSTRV
ncbi:AbiH family protein [Weissella confusa]